MDIHVCILGLDTPALLVVPAKTGRLESLIVNYEKVHKCRLTKIVLRTAPFLQVQFVHNLC